VDYRDQVAIVTGSSRGIGREVAKLLAARGAQVVVNGRTAPAVETVRAEIRAAGGVATGFPGDVSDPDTARDLVTHAVDTFGRIDIVVNNAGVLSSIPFPAATATEFETLMKVNVLGPILVTQAAWPYFVGQGHGRIVVMSSTSVFGARDSALYTASKGALIGLMRSLAIDGREHGILANAVMPVAFTDMMTNVQQGDSANAQDGAELWAAAAGALTAELVAPVVAWLVHPDSDVSGEILSTGGGRVARVFMAESQGFVDAGLCLEALRDRWPEVCTEDRYTVHGDFLTSVGTLMRHAGVFPPAG
jgi:NAD(P)-dependent dehydrogenase (short-subunit alcohol dehydrogenase family)